jgi:acyl-CoA synthetase (AMP-forming)/AMP-acid ligase II
VTARGSAAASGAGAGSLQGERLWDRWARWGRERGSREAIVHWKAGEEPRRYTWSALVDAAGHEAGALAAAGVRRGDVCALIVRHHPRFYPLYMGISALGAVPSVLAYPNARLHPDKFVQGLGGMARRSGLDWILTERALEATVRPLVAGDACRTRGVLLPLEAPASGASPAPETTVPREVAATAPCLLQHSSGTTGLQKGVALSHRAVLQHVESYASAIQLTDADRVVSWLPLYHDMGLIAGFHMPLAAGLTLVQLDPFEWVSAPVLLLEALSREQGTLTWLPNFAYNLLAERVHADEVRDLRLDGVRMFVNCSEPVRDESHGRFLDRFAANGVRRQALATCYAMAELTFAATQTVPGREAPTLAVDREALSRGEVAPPRAGASSRTCVSSGAPIPGCRIKILAEDGREVSPGRVGEIAIQSPTMFEGYSSGPEESARVLVDGWYHSGDLGFLQDGECYVIGRLKDVIIVAGNNVYPEDVEDAVAAVPGVSPGRVVAFGAEVQEAGTESVCVVAETDVTDPEQRKRLALAIRRAGMAVDVTIAHVHLAPPRWLIKSSSGKPSRKANRDRIEREPPPLSLHDTRRAP